MLKKERKILEKFSEKNSQKFNKLLHKSIRFPKDQKLSDKIFVNIDIEFFCFEEELEE